jgi:hypothetical protein
MLLLNLDFQLVFWGTDLKSVPQNLETGAVRLLSGGQCFFAPGDGFLKVEILKAALQGVPGPRVPFIDKACQLS